MAAVLARLTLRSTLGPLTNIVFQQSYQADPKVFRWETFEPKFLVTSISYVYAMLLFASLGSTALVRVIGTMFPGARVMGAVFAASHERLKVVLTKKWGRLLFAITIATVFYKLFGGNIQLVPPSGGETRRWLDITSVWLFYAWLNVGALRVGGMASLYKGLKLDSAIKKMLALSGINGMATGLLLAFVTLYLETPFAAAGMAAAYAATLWNKWSFLRLVAFLRRFRAPMAEDRSREEDVAQPFLIHVSDIHVTGNKDRRVDGGYSGDAICCEITGRLTATALPKFCLITGDLIDRGEQGEWDFVMPHLTMLRNRGCRVLLAPGNHDLATAYVPSVAFEFLHSYPPGRAVIDATRLINYLSAATALEPGLRTYAGKEISTVIKCEVTPVKKLQEDWKAAGLEAKYIILGKAKVPAALGVDPEFFGPRILGRLATMDESAAARLLDPLIDRAMKEFPPPTFVSGERGRQAWHYFFTNAPDFQFQQVDLAKKWEPLWTDLFPMRLRAEEHNVEFFIVNSTDPNPGLLGSAFGHLSREQIERLATAVSECAGRIVVILMHHAICGWIDSLDDLHNTRRVDVEKWGLLVHDTEESNQLVALFSTLIETAAVKQLVVCSGHRHGASRAGPILDQQRHPIASGRVLLMESAAGCDFSGVSKGNMRQLLFANIGVDKMLRPYRSPLDRLPELKRAAVTPADNISYPLP